MGHAHRKLRHLDAVSFSFITQLAKPPEIRPRLFRVGIIRGHGHQSLKPQIPALPDMAEERQQVLLRNSLLALFRRELHLDQNTLHLADLRSLTIKFIGKRKGIDRMDEIKQPHRIFCLVLLEMTDQMPLHRLMAVRFLREMPNLVPGFLDPVLRKHPKTGIHCLPDALHRHRLAYRNKPCRIGRSARTHGGVAHLPQYVGGICKNHGVYSSTNYKLKQEKTAMRPLERAKDLWYSVAMFDRQVFTVTLKLKLIMIMLGLSCALILILLFFYAHAEKRLHSELETQARELTKAIQVGVEEVTGKGATDEARLEKYLKDLNTRGVKEISIISNTDEIVASSDRAKIGRPITHRRKELIIKAELGEPVSEEGKAYNVIIPVIAGDTQYGYIHLKINLEDFSRLQRETAIQRILATIVVFCVGMIAIFILARRYTQPINTVVDAAMRVAAGDLNQHIPVQSRDEIGKLSESFNFMVEKLRESRALEEKLRAAEHLSGLGELSRSIAHEIRNPLNFINLSIDHLNDKYQPEEVIRRNQFASILSGMKQEIHRLNKLVNDFLMYSKPMKLSRQQVSATALLEDVVALVWAKAEADGITIIKEYADDRDIWVDPDLFKSCLLNVITNAFHAMASRKDGGILKVRTEFSDDHLTITVIDNGEGVSPDKIARIFEPFFSSKEYGLGLGLPMTKKVIEEHGGRVVFLSTPGEGSEVRFILPVRQNDSNQ